MSKRIGGKAFVEVLRGTQVESLHDVAIHAVDAVEEVPLSFGNVDTPVYLRSSAKPFIAGCALDAGVLERFNLEDREVAVMAASHSAEPFHIDAVRSILRKIGLDENALQCGADLPYNEGARRDLQVRGIGAAPIYNNCSGKHAGILALCKAIGADPNTYMELANPAQQLILTFCARLSNGRLADLPIAIDGCGIPVYATPLRNAAISYLRFATLTNVEPNVARALRTVREAMIAYPEYMSGTGEFDAALIRAFEGNLVCKGGAEGVHAVAIFDPGIALVVKVVDGNERARPPAVIAALERMGMVTPRQKRELENFASPLLKNRAGRVVGRIRPVEL